MIDITNEPVTVKNGVLNFNGTTLHLNHQTQCLILAIQQTFTKNHRASTKQRYHDYCLVMKLILHQFLMNNAISNSSNWSTLERKNHSDVNFTLPKDNQLNNN